MCLGQQETKENTKTVCNDVRRGKCPVVAEGLKQFQTHSHRKEGNTQPQVMGPLWVDICKPQHEHQVGKTMSQLVTVLELQGPGRFRPQRQAYNSCDQEPPQCKP
jgi:hypothetical protein